MITRKSRAFTLVEVLISITLLSLVLMALYRSADILRKSNKNLFHHLQKSSNLIKGANTLYMDILASNGKILINSNEKFHHIIIEKTSNSLYGLYKSKVVWLVYKEKNSLLRIEGGDYQLPLRGDKGVAIDKIEENIELFKIYKNKKKNKILVLIKGLNQNLLSFMITNLQIKVVQDKIVKVPIIGGSVSKKREDKPMLE
jgi:prepilin-type N-terminal cleavage/methylation domain-containing protein